MFFPIENVTVLYSLTSKNHISFSSARKRMQVGISRDTVFVSFNLVELYDHAFLSVDFVHGKAYFSAEIVEKLQSETF